MKRQYFVLAGLLLVFGIAQCKAVIHKQKVKSVPQKASRSTSPAQKKVTKKLPKQKTKLALRKPIQTKPPLAKTVAPLKKKLGVQFVPYQQEKSQLIQQFDNKLTFQGMPLKFNYDHVFQGDFYPNGQIGGLHHDWMNRLQKSQKVKFGPLKKRWPNGMYRITVFHLNTPNDKTLYPADWSRIKVMQKVFEAFNNQVPVTGIAKGGRSIIEGLTSEGIRIRLVIDQNGNVVTFFPVS